MKSLTLNPSIHSDSHVIAVNLPSLSPAQPVRLYSKSSTSPLHLLDGFLLRIKQGVLWFPLGELCRGSRSCSPSSTASWDTKRACVLCQGTWWHFWASESLWISALESGFLEAASQTGPVSGTLSHARPSICRLSIRLLWRGPCSRNGMENSGICSMFFFFQKSYPSKWTLKGAMDQSLVSNVCKTFVSMVTIRQRRVTERSGGEETLDVFALNAVMQNWTRRTCIMNSISLPKSGV